MERKFKNYLNLFWTWFKIGICTFGGGYAMIALIQEKLVEDKKWTTDEELSKIIAIAESTPGPIAINSATYIGHKLLGVLGSVCATFGVVLPSFIVIFVISLFFDNLLQYTVVANAFKGIQAAVAALILIAGFRMFNKSKKDFLCVAVFTVALAATVAIEVFDVNFSSLFLIIAGAVVGLFSVLLPRKSIDDASVSTNEKKPKERSKNDDVDEKEANR